MLLNKEHNILLFISRNYRKKVDFGGFDCRLKRLL